MLRIDQLVGFAGVWSNARGPVVVVGGKGFCF